MIASAAKATNINSANRPDPKSKAAPGSRRPTTPPRVLPAT